ncbi:uncharacterized protein LOC120080967 [Benincasa hispida]|uniref:uncharacterized protein LOC120080967 n=1 Tax=Benincasa hispida TaxID=102211 RepID=UPI0018FFAB87|nr:uncharacterized protein LOC120080967 [Benincasa hispida]
MTTDDDTKPLWQYVTKNERLNEGRGNISWQCNFCQENKKGSYTRVRAHLLKLSGFGIGICKKITHKDLAEMQKLEDEAKTRIARNAPKQVPLPPSRHIQTKSQSFGTGSGNMVGSYSNSYSTMEQKKRKGNVSALEKSFNLAIRDQVDSEIARMFCSSGLSFHLARNPHYVNAFSLVTNNALSGYITPEYNKLSTILLQKEKTNIERLLQSVKSTWSQKGVSIASDGWSDSQRRPLINFMEITEGGPMFLKAVDCSGETKDKYFIANLMKEVINEVGHENVIQIITDNAANCKGAGQIIESQFPSIVWTPCVVHTLNLALKNICAARNINSNQHVFAEFSWISEISNDVMFVKHFIMNHSMRLAMFNEFVSLKLLAVAETRFSSTIIILRRFKLIKGGLQTVVISNKWGCYREDDMVKARSVKKLVLNDIWWDKIDYILFFTTTIYDMIRDCDTDKPCLHLVYDIWDTMIEKVKVAIYKHEGKHPDESSSFYGVVHQILIDRWNKNNTPLHCLAHSLNPRYSKTS